MNKEYKEFKEWRDYFIKNDPIGKGTYSKVYYGYHKETNNKIALKKIYFNNLHNKIKDRIVTEINILQRINHKNIIKLYDYKFDGDYILLIMEYCNGGDLKSWVLNKPNEDCILSVINQISSGIYYLHTNNIIHRDIKPENIIFHNEDIKICDFGFSKTIKDSKELFDTMCGTPLYMSPEILFLQKYNISSEIWSLGILFYTILYNKHPFGDLENIEEYRSKIKNKISIKFDKEKYKNIYIVKLIEIIRDMLNYDMNSRPSISNIMDIIDIRDDIYISEKIVSPFCSYNSPDLVPNMSDLNIEKLELRRDDKLYERVLELEEKINKLELTLYDKDIQNKENIFFDINEKYFIYNRGERDENKNIKSNPIFINKKKSFVGSIYNFIAKSF
jgi:serine/threonine protein kinase